MRSAEHRAIILDTGYTRVGVGVGVAKANGIMWVVVDFADQGSAPVAVSVVRSTIRPLIEPTSG
jgi:hypothetical protein